MRPVLPRVAVLFSFGALLFAQSQPVAQSQPEIRTTVFHGSVITYEVRGSYAVVQGDIILGTLDEVEAESRGADAASQGAAPRSATVAPVFSASLWPNGTIPYVIDPALPNPQIVTRAVQHWNTHTPLHVIPRTKETNYVVFTSGTFDAACDSSIGMVGGAQQIQITSSCTTGNLIHEIGHAFGLFHEQTRSDRNSYVTVLWDNIDKRYRSDFDQLPGEISSTGYYDYDSIMHYNSLGFSRNDLDTIETVPVGIPIGQRVGLSAGDIDGVSRLYGFVLSKTTVTTVPAGLKIVVDGVTAASPQSFAWAPGSTHTVQVQAMQGSDPRYVFARWSDGGAQAHSVIAGPNATVFAAVFSMEHTLDAHVAMGSGSISVTPSPVNGYYPDRLQVRVQEFPSGDQFLDWAGYSDFDNNGYGFSTPSADLDITLPLGQFAAEFTNAPVTIIDSQPSRLPVIIDGGFYITPARFTWNAGEQHTMFASGPLTSGNDTVRYNFQQWDDGSKSFRTVTAGAGAATYTVTFSTQYLLSELSTSGGQLFVSPGSTDGYYNAGTMVQVLAVPSSGSTLRYWLGDTAGAVTTQTLQMTEDRIAIAIFGSSLVFRVVNAANNSGNTTFDQSGSIVAPGELVALYGKNIGPATAVTGQFDANQLLPTLLGGIQVLFDGHPAPIVYASANQINVIVPSTVGQASSSTQVQVVRGGVVTASSSTSAGATAPGLFTIDGSGRGPVTAYHSDGSPISAVNPASPGSVITLVATGTGLPSQPIPDGQRMGSTLIQSSQPVQVRIGKLAADVLYAGSMPGSANGITEVMVRVPPLLLSGPAVPIQLIAGQVNSPPDTTIAIQ